MSNADVKVAGHTVKCSWGKESGDPNNLPTNAQVSSTNIQFQKCQQKPLKWRSYQIDKDNESLKIPPKPCHTTCRLKEHMTF